MKNSFLHLGYKKKFLILTIRGRPPRSGDCQARFFAKRKPRQTWIFSF